MLVTWLQVPILATYVQLPTKNILQEIEIKITKNLDFRLTLLSYFLRPE